MRFDTKIHIRLRDAYAVRHEPEAERMLAQALWSACVALVGVALVVSVAYGVWEFSRMPHADEESTLRAQPGFTRTQIETLLNVFDTRAEEFELRLRAPAAPDPS